MSARAWMVRLAAVLALAACGGGDGVGSGGTGARVLHAGTVTGFGSVVVDGTAYDDRTAPVTAERGDGSTVAATLRLGHRVEVELGSDAADVRAITRTAELRGRVDAVDATSLRLLGQRVLVNTDARSGPRTQFGGATSLSGLAPGDAVEVHGFRRRVGGGWVVQATRIERLDSPGGLLVAGIVERLSGGSGDPVFHIAGLRVEAGGAALVPAAQALAEGQRVTVWGDALGGTAMEPVLVATRVRIAPRSRGAFDAALAGGIDGVDATNARFDLGGIEVDYADADVVPPIAAVENGRYARVLGRWSADGSRFVATRVILRGGDGAAEADLTGPIEGWNAAARSFSVRGVAVDARGATVSDCPATGLADGLRVKVDGTLGDDGVVAVTVRCLGG